jgi:hypothetical protein
VPESGFPAALSGECGRAGADMAAVRRPKHERFGRIRLGATLNIRRTGPESARNAYRRQSAWENPMPGIVSHTRRASLGRVYTGHGFSRVAIRLLHIQQLGAAVLVLESS